VVVVAIDPRHHDVVKQVVDELEDAGKETPALTVEVVETPTPLALEEGVAGFDVIHYVGFGRFSDGNDQIALGDEAGDIEYVTIDAVADSLPQEPPKLVVLQLCAADKETVPADFAVLAPTLLDQVPAVLAYQYPLAPDVAGDFNRVLYKQLAAGMSVETAVQGARNKLRLAGRAFASPALWVERPGRLRLVSPSREATSGHQQRLAASRG
jgi:hypothetical protein